MEIIIEIMWIFIGMALIVCTCFIDDVKGLSAVTKLIVQILAASAVVASGIRIDITNIEFFQRFADSTNF